LEVALYKHTHISTLDSTSQLSGKPQFIEAFFVFVNPFIIKLK